MSTSIRCPARQGRLSGVPNAERLAKHTLPPQQCHLLVRRQESTLQCLWEIASPTGLNGFPLVAPYARYVLRRVCRAAQVSGAAARERGRCAGPPRLGEDLAELAALLSTNTLGGPHRAAGIQLQRETLSKQLRRAQACIELNSVGCRIQRTLEYCLRNLSFELLRKLVLKLLPYRILCVR